MEARCSLKACPLKEKLIVEHRVQNSGGYVGEYVSENRDFGVWQRRVTVMLCFSILFCCCDVNAS